MIWTYILKKLITNGYVFTFKNGRKGIMRKFLLGFLMSLLVIFLVACGSDDDAEKTENDEEDSEEPQTVTVEHELGTTEVDKNPEKVVVFDMGSLDTLDKLGIEVTGVPQQSVPDYLSKYEGDEYENVGGLKEPDFEKIAEIDPDLIIISGRQGDMYDELQELGAADALDAIEEKIDKAKETAEEADKNGLIILANDDKISAYGPSSRFGLIHDVVGVPAVDEGIEVSTHGQNVSFEYVVEQDPDLIYVIDRGAAIGEGESATKLIVENKLMEDTKAMQNDDIYYLDPEYWYLS